ncbi:hypothetical protein A2824_03210 [Candidatus Nomurabacteria bacterium RIFCSPHIGHO2_01_FULL_42_16]|uniref:Uncharacterized protein n=1 Tax=Candidatus Nomurabacteria bacterium RIFCSPHIGHO2_01_FULL_42_16 TaxID=1801743 RepID=A0A1F6VJE5_9BACT|nr:MAG: hypothetical protein A2824_03210 [Candidatus Nomurabacteria bacterium RIFCSPHIGHO2_01_FULL_42_16]
MMKLEKTPENFIEVEGVRFYGSPDKKLSKNEIYSVDLPLDSELHILRHLSSLEKEFRQKLIGQKMINPYTGQETIINEEYIDSQISTAGGKFNQEQKRLNSPEKIKEIVIQGAEKIIESKDIQWFRKGKQKRCIFSVTFTPELKQNFELDPNIPIGFSNLVKITKELENLTYQKQRGEKEEADQQATKFIQLENPPATETITAVFAWFDNRDNPQLFAVHPGIITPPFPNAKFQSAEELEYNKKFWDQHAFVETKTKTKE